jgi:hypothetical protein
MATARRGTSWTTIGIYGVVILGVIAAVYFLGKSYQRQQTKANRKDPEPLPNSGKGIPQGWQDQAETLAKTLYDTMDGLNFYAASEEWERLASPELTDDMVTAVYNAFNRKYSARTGATLTEWIRSQWAIGNAADTKQQAINRLEEIGLP